jgi:hypothetical protein
MAERRIRTGGPLEERIPQHIIADHDWVHVHRDELIDKYGETYVIVYQQKVLGVGKSREEALTNAERNLAPDIDQIAVMVEWVGHRRPLLRNRAHKTTGDNA